MAESNVSGGSNKKVLLVGMDDSKESFHSLEWTVEHLLTPASLEAFKLILIHVKIPALSVLRFSGPGVGSDVIPLIESDLNKKASFVTEKAKELCKEHSISDYEVEVWEGDARSVLCEAVEKHHADVLIVGSHGYGAFKRAILGSVSDYCAHHARCSVLIVKKDKPKN